jgi:hypothetical protein
MSILRGSPVSAFPHQRDTDGFLVMRGAPTLPSRVDAKAEAKGEGS